MEVDQRSETLLTLLPESFSPRSDILSKHDGKVHVRGRRFLLLVVLLFIAVSLAGPAQAYNNWNGSERRWPWKAFSSTTLKTLPCNEDPDPNKNTNNPHCTETDPQAIDANLGDRTKVYSIAAGTFYRYAYDSCAGNYLVIKGAHSDYYAYKHLYSSLVSSGSILAGQPIAFSSGTGRCVTGPHLHFQRSSQPPFTYSPLNLTPISAQGDGYTTLNKTTGYTSDNAGIGYDSNDYGDAKMASTFNASGGYTGMGVPADVGANWSPCRAALLHGTWSRYGCTASSSFTGFVQTYFLGANNDPQALMQWSSANSTAFRLYTGILGVYTDYYNGKDLVYSIGYPTGNRYYDYSVSFFRQSFQNGHIDFIPSSTGCTENAYMGPTFVHILTAYYCDQ
jgi:hypothetical protein